MTKNLYKVGFIAALVSTILICNGLLLAQDPRPTRRDLVQAIEDPETFGKTVNFLGTLRGGVVIFDETCDFPPGELDPSDRCVLINPPPSFTNADERNLGSITLPGNSAKTNIYLIPTHIVDYQFFNGTGVFQNNGFFRYNPYITLESAALNDPRAVDPITNLPLNGRLDMTLSSVKIIDRTLAVNERIRDRSNYSRALITGINKPFLNSEIGLPSDIVDRMFREPLTIHMNMNVRTRYVNFGTFLYAVRIMGN